MYIEFVIRIKVDENIPYEESLKQANEFDEMLSEMEDLAAKRGYEIDDQKWEAEPQ